MLYTGLILTSLMCLCLHEDFYCCFNSCLTWSTFAYKEDPGSFKSFMVSHALYIDTSVILANN